MARICWGRSTSFLVYNFVFQAISEKIMCCKDFTRKLRGLLCKNNPNFNSCKFIYKLNFISFLPLSRHRNQKQESNFQQVGCLVTRNSFDFCLYRVVLYFKVMLNSIDFYKRIFLHVIPVRIIVPCFMAAKIWRYLIIRSNCLLLNLLFWFA